jgi:hypothetical protein
MAEMNPLRRRMIEDMKIRNLSPATQRCYVHAVAKFARYYKRSPDRLGLAEVRAYQVHLASTGISWAGFLPGVAERVFRKIRETLPAVNAKLTKFSTTVTIIPSLSIRARRGDGLQSGVLRCK